jgi:hypothetical protein
MALTLSSFTSNTVMPHSLCLHFEVCHLQQQLQRRQQGAKPVAQFLLQASQPGLIRRLRQLPVNLNALPRVRDVAEENVGEGLPDRASRVIIP